MTVGRDARLKASPHVHARPFDDELVLLDLEGGSYYGLDEIGARFWAGLSEGRSPREVAESLNGLYRVDPETLLNDLVALADQLLEKGLVVVDE